jgi:hypothetical protein
MKFALIAFWLLVELSPAWQARASGKGSNWTTTQSFNGDQIEAFQNLLREELSMRLGVQSDVRIERVNRHIDWIFVCGRPLTPGGSPMDYSKTLLRDQYLNASLDDYFCTLLLESSKSAIELKEFAVGDTDAPFIDWLGKHGLPASILDYR